MSTPSWLGLALLLALLGALLATSMDASARRDIVADDFNTSFDGGPNPALWRTECSSGASDVSVGDGVLRTAQSGMGQAYCWLARPFSSRNFTLTVDWYRSSYTGKFLELVVLSSVEGTYGQSVVLGADTNGFYFAVRDRGSFDTVRVGHYSRIDTTYRFTVRIEGGFADLSAFDMSANATLWTWSHNPFDGLTTRNTVRLGVTSTYSTEDPEAIWDNFELYDHISGPNTAPVWGRLPKLGAEEGVPRSYDFSGNITDDQEPWELSITSASACVAQIVGLKVTFQFPQGPLNRTVELTASDGSASSGANVSFTVTPMNDPPSHSLPPTMDAVEGIPLVWDLSPYVWDVDNDTADLHIVENSPYATTDGLVLTVVFPEGMRQYSLRFMVSDGLLESGVIVTFLISATANPPVIRDIGQVNVTENVETVLGLVPYVVDPDTGFQNLVIATTSDNITVEGFELHILCTEGGVLEAVTLIVSDGVSATRRDFFVSVSSRDDPPVIGEVPLQNVIEDKEGSIDLASYITDEDTPLWSLGISCEWPRVTNVTALIVSVLYETAIDSDTVPFNVTDGYSTVTGHFTVHVNPVNDPPRLLGIGSASPPITLTVYAGKWTYLDLKAVDEEEMTLTYSVVSPQSGLSTTANKLRIAPLSIQLAPFQARLTVSDSAGATDSFLFTVVVLDPSEAPISVQLVSPANHSTYQEGEAIPFSVNVLFSTGTPHGPVEARWSSDLQGSVLRLTSTTGLSANVSWLTPGDHRITVVATSGALTATAWFGVTVTGRETGGGGGSDGTIDSANMMLLVSIAIIIAIVVVTSAAAMMVNKPGTAAPPGSAKPPPPVIVMEPPPAGGPIRPAPTAMAAQPRVATVPPRTSAAPAPKPPPPQASTRPAAARGLPSQTVQARAATESKEGQKARIAAVKAAIEAMPGGIPRELSLFDSWTIAERIVKGKTMTAPDGTPLVNVMGEWYVNTPDAPGRFLKPWRE